MVSRYHCTERNIHRAAFDSVAPAEAEEPCCQDVIAGCNLFIAERAEKLPNAGEPRRIAGAGENRLRRTTRRLEIALAIRTSTTNMGMNEYPQRTGRLRDTHSGAKATVLSCGSLWLIPVLRFIRRKAICPRP